MFLEMLPQRIPCAACRTHMSQHYADLDVVNSTVQGKEGIRRFVWRLHNMVNAAVGKPQVSWENAQAVEAQGKHSAERDWWDFLTAVAWDPRPDEGTRTHALRREFLELAIELAPHSALWFPRTCPHPALSSSEASIPLALFNARQACASPDAQAAQSFEAQTKFFSLAAMPCAASSGSDCSSPPAPQSPAANADLPATVPSRSCASAPPSVLQRLEGGVHVGILVMVLFVCVFLGMMYWQSRKRSFPNNF